MALKKSFRSRLRRSHTKRRFIRKNRILRSIPISKRIHTFRRLGAKTIIYITGAGAISSQGSPSTDSGFTLSSVLSDALTGCYQFGFSHNFQMVNVVQPTDLTQLFDRYKIVGVKYRVYYHCNDAAVQGLQVLPLVHYSMDTDDSAAPTNLETVQAKGDCKTKVLGNNQYIQAYIKPKVAIPVYRTGASNAYDVERSKWINSSYTDVQHYGIKFWLNQVYMASSNNTAITIEPVYYIRCMDSQ